MNAFFSNPGSALQWAIPLYTSSTLHIRLTFWCILSAVFMIIGDVRAQAPLYYIPTDIVLMIAVLCFHELGHRVFSRWVGGNHWEWVLWPLGGMIAPTAPRRPWPTFVANIGGNVFTVALAVAALGCIALVDWAAFHLSFGGILDPSELVRRGFLASAGSDLAMHSCAVILSMSMEIVLINFFPCYWFDGGYIWQSILWPFLGLYRAILITCLAGMILSFPLFLLSLLMQSFLGMIFWILVFSACFIKRRELKAAGPGVISDEDENIYNYMDTPEPRRKARKKKGWVRAAARKAAKERAEQAQIDAILAKVHDKGLHSLSWLEKRALRKATERQRQRDLAERL